MLNAVPEILRTIHPAAAEARFYAPSMEGYGTSGHRSAVYGDRGEDCAVVIRRADLKSVSRGLLGCGCKITLIAVRGGFGKSC